MCSGCARDELQPQPLGTSQRHTGVGLRTDGPRADARVLGALESSVAQRAFN